MMFCNWFKIAFSVILFVLYPATEIQAGDECEVLLPEISEEYEGGCRNGLAHGMGEASGDDRYEGRFRRGFPDGRGTYVWSDGSIYEGRWREGKRDGRGVYKFIEDGVMKTKSGVWQADTFLRERVSRPYTVGHVLNVERYTVKKIADEPDRILVTLQHGGRKNISARNFTFLLDGTGETYSIGHQTGYQNVDFPAQCRITYETPGRFRQVVYRVLLEIDIREPGDWLITIYN